ncbi:zf-HC2 domain-containing protein [candidate division KSB1 bacterium]|nr:zf-HC2 domain-containing protein [candidate division KSB1 bacterium]
MAPCQRFAQDLSDFADNELDKISKGRLTDHLNKCPNCAKYLKQIQVLRSYLRELSPIKPTQEFVPILRDRMRKFQQEKSRPERTMFFPGHRLVPVLGIGALSLLVVFLLVDQSPKSSVQSTRMAVQKSQSVESPNNALALESDTQDQKVASGQSGFAAQVAESDTLARADSTSNSQDLDAVRSRIRAVNY